MQHIKQCLVPFGDFFNFNDELKEVKASPMTWNQSQFAQELMQFDVKSYTSSDGENFVFILRKDQPFVKESGIELYAEYSVEVLPNFVVFLDYGFCIKNNPMDGIWITIEDILNSLKFAQKFKNKKIKQKSQEMMKRLIDGLQLGQIFILRSHISEYYMDLKDGAISMERQKKFIEPYAYSLFLMSLVLNSKNDIMKFGEDLLNFKKNYPQIKTNQDIMAVIVHILNNQYKDKDKTLKLVKNTWNAVNVYIKKEMASFETTLIQDLIIRDELYANNENKDNDFYFKLDCGLNIRIDDKIVLLSTWIQFQRLRELLLSIVQPS